MTQNNNFANLKRQGKEQKAVIVLEDGYWMEVTAFCSNDGIAYSFELEVVN